MTSHTLDQFQAAMRARGLIPPNEMIADGKIHRCNVEGENGKNDGSYLIHSDFPQAGGFENWRDGKGWEKWSVKAENPLSDSEKENHRRRWEAIQREQEAEAKKRIAEIEEKAIRIWDRASPCTSHPYLIRKGIQAHGLRMHGAALLIPVGDNKGDLRGLQSIDSEGKKKFLPGTQKTGNYFLIGNPKEVLCISEGFATAVSIHEATGYAVAVAFDCGNLLPVAERFRENFPNLKIILCGDDDFESPGNPGKSKATEAAEAVGGFVAFPNFGKDRPSGATDFNDLHRIKGLEAVKACIDAAFPALKTESPSFEKNRNNQAVELIQASTLKPEPVEWLWPGWLAAGKLHILAGAAGTGKTTLALSLAATPTVGGRWPDGSPARKGSVVIWSGEDDFQDTLLPRLMACGADRNRIFFIGGVQEKDGENRPFDPAKDVQILCRELSKIGDVKLLIVDPIVSAVTGDSNKNAEVRRALQPLVDLAASKRCAILGITHFSKGTAGREPLERLTGSLAFGALARIVWVTSKIQTKGGETKNNSSSRILLRAKSNIGTDSGGFKYDLWQSELKESPGIFASSVLWGDPVEGTAREILAETEGVEGKERSGALEEAKRFLTDLLSDEPLPQKRIREEAKEAGISWATILRAKTALKIASKKTGMKGGWEWHLPRRCSNELEDTQQKEMSTFGHLEHLRQKQLDLSGACSLARDEQGSWFDQENFEVSNEF